ADALIRRVGAEPRRPCGLVARLDRHRSSEREPDRADAHGERAAHAIAFRRYIARPGDATCRHRQVHEKGPHRRARRVHRDAVLELHATSRNARAVHTPAIARLYSALPRRSSIGSAAEAARAAASRIASSSTCRPTRMRSASCARNVTGPAPPTAMRACVHVPSGAVATTAATDTVA